MQQAPAIVGNMPKPRRGGRKKAAASPEPSKWYLKGAYTFRHGVSLWWGVTIMRDRTVVKAMFSSEEAARKYLTRHGIRRVTWSESITDLYDRHHKG